MPLTRAEIITAAIDATELGELESLTMRSLAEQLGVTAMALYAHVANKDEILDEIINQVLARDALPLPHRHADCRQWTIDSAEHLRGVLARYPALLDRYCRRPVGVPAALTRMETALEVLRRAGFDDTTCVATYATIHTYTLGFAALEIARTMLSERPITRRADQPLTEESPHYWPAVFAGLPPSEYPNLTRLTPDLATFTNHSQFHHGLLTILDGLDTQRSTKLRDQ